jgi:predicted RNase H-like nuclease
MWPVIEMYPHPGHIEMFSLPSILKYKRSTADEKRAGLARYMDLLERLQDRELALQVRTVHCWIPTLCVSEEPL